MKHSNFKKFLVKAKFRLNKDKYIEGIKKFKLTNTLAQPTNTLSQRSNSQAESSSDRSGTDKLLFSLLN